MKKIILIVTIFAHVFASGQNWQWANSVGSIIVQSTDFAKVITDGSNAYLAGRYSNVIYLQTDTLYAPGNNGLFVIKYDANGNELWAKGFGGNNVIPNNYNAINAVFNSTDNHIYLTGRFYGLMIIGSDTLIASNSLSDIYLAKMDLNGNFIWGKSIVTPLAEDNIPCVFVQPDGNIFLAGTVGDSAYLDSFQIPPGGFFSRYDTSGNCLWARHQFDGIGNLEVNVAFIGNDIIMGGHFNVSPTTIDTVTLLPNNLSYDGYLVRMDSVGSIKWIETFGYSGLDAVSDIEVDNSDNIYFAGVFEDSITFNGNMLSNAGRDIFIAKYTANGSLIWARQTNSVGNLWGAGDVQVENDGSCYITGSFSGSATFGTYFISTSNPYDMFLARYNNNGACMGAINFGHASGNSVVTDNAGNPICSGIFRNTVTIGSSTLTSNGDNDIFLAKCEVFTGIQNFERLAGNKLIIYANPNAGKCNITIPAEFQHEKNLTLSIFDNNGKLIQQLPVQMNENLIKLNLEAEAKGMYNVTLSNGNKNYNGKILFE